MTHDEVSWMGEIPVTIPVDCPIRFVKWTLILRRRRTKSPRRQKAIAKRRARYQRQRRAMASFNELAGYAAAYIDLKKRAADENQG